MRFSSCFGNQSPSHRDTRLSPHPGKFQHIFAKNAKMLARKTFENTFASIVFFFACFHGLLLTRHCSLNLWTCPHRDQGFNLKLKRALVLPGVWTRHNLKSWFQKFFLFWELKLGPSNPRLLRFLIWSNLWCAFSKVIVSSFVELLTGGCWPSGRRQGQGLRAAAAVFHEYTLLPQLYTLYFTFFCISWMRTFHCHLYFLKCTFV